FLAGRVGSGTYLTSEASVPARRRPARAALRPRAGWTFAPSPTTAEQPPPRYDFRAGVPDAALFPFDTWRRLVASHIRPGAHRPGGYAEPSGYRPLREAISRYLAYSRGVTADPDDVVVTAGSQQALDLVGRVLLQPGDHVAVEDPGYPPARDLFASLGAQVVPVPVDDAGLVVDRLPRRARLVYVTPSHQFPLGVTMSLARRRALLEWADTCGAAVVEDDYDSEFRFSPRPLQPLHVLDASGRVIYVGTFSKTLIPALRLGFVVAPGGLRSALRAARQLSDGHGPVATQAALAQYLDEGLLARHIRTATRVYAARHAALRESLQSRLAGTLEPLSSEAGLHLAARAPWHSFEVTETVVDECRAAGVGIGTLGSYALRRPGQAGFVFGYGAIPVERVAEGVARFAAILDAHARRSP
ncbi:MAG: PLP-dependent aminotransferase family protein, partial [Acidimicrobiales bacterium]